MTAAHGRLHASRICLASASPRRLDLLRAIGIEPQVIPADVDESLRAGELPESAARRLAEAKARVVAARAPGPFLILAADTVVAVERDVLGKPRDRAEAEAMVRRLSGRVHRVSSGLALIESVGGRLVSGVATTEVAFLPIPEEEIRWYAATGEGRDKAGGYAIQGLAALFVRELRGSYSNVVGLPLELLRGLARELGTDLRSFMAQTTGGVDRNNPRERT